MLKLQQEHVEFQGPQSKRGRKLEEGHVTAEPKGKGRGLVLALGDDAARSVSTVSANLCPALNLHMCDGEWER